MLQRWHAHSAYSFVNKIQRLRTYVLLDIVIAREDDLKCQHTLSLPQRPLFWVYRPLSTLSSISYMVLSQNQGLSDLNLLPPLVHRRRRISVVLRFVVREHRRLGVCAVSLRAGLRTTVRFDRTPGHPNAQYPKRKLSALVRGKPHNGSSWSDLLKHNCQNQHQRSKRSCRACVPTGRHSCYNQHSKPEDTFQAVEDGVGFGACPFAEAVCVLCQHLVGDDEE